jgi:Ca-activated chloride channel homolog
MGAARCGKVPRGIWLLLLCLLTLACLSSAQSPPSASPVPTSQQESRPAQSQATQPQTAAPQGQATPPQEDDSGGFVFKKEVEEVILHATVVDDQNRLITGLGKDNFRVYEDNKPQEVTSFRKERVPVALGILIDNSGSMLPKRAKVNEAALQLVDASQQEDRVFVVNFGEDAFLDQDYTEDVGKLRAALQRVETRGSTALYDALIGAVNHLNQTSPRQKKVLLVVTDGRDNASQATFEEVSRKLQSKNGPVLYTIALEQNDRQDGPNRQALRALSEQTGGTAFFPSSLDEVQSIASSIAQDIRSQYIIGYRSTNSHAVGAYHSIQVQALEGSAGLRVTTRTGYYSGNLGNADSHCEPQSHTKASSASALPKLRSSTAKVAARREHLRAITSAIFADGQRSSPNSPAPCGEATPARV